MRAFKPFLALSALILLACLSGVDGQYTMPYQSASQSSQYYPTMPMTSAAVAPATTSTGGAGSYDFSGIALKVSEPNSMTVSVTSSSTNEIALGSKVEVLFEPGLADLSYFRNKALQFEILGHDILGRPVCDVYLNGRKIQDVYWCRQYPALCAYYGSYFNNELIGTEAYSGRYYYYWPYYHGSYPYYDYNYGNPYSYGSSYYWSSGYY